MWHILKTELHYSKYGLLAFFIMIPILFIWRESSSTNSFDSMMTLWLVLMLNTMMPSRNKEKRDRQIKLLPVPTVNMGMVRILLILIPCTFIYFEMVILMELFKQMGPLDHRELLYALGFVLLIYAVYFVLHDLLISQSRKLRMAIKASLVILIAIPLVLGVVVLIITQNTEESPIQIEEIFDFVRTNNPFSGVFGAVKFFILNLVLILLSLVTFAQRKSYLE